MASSPGRSFFLRTCCPGTRHAAALRLRASTLAQMGRRTDLGHEFVTVAGGQLEYWCDGEGPTVVFLSAFGGDDSLEPIAKQLADEAYVCFYFRPGDFHFRPGDGPVPDRPRTAGSRLARACCCRR